MRLVLTCGKISSSRSSNNTTTTTNRRSSESAASANSTATTTTATSPKMCLSGHPRYARRGSSTSSDLVGAVAAKDTLVGEVMAGFAAVEVAAGGNVPTRPFLSAVESFTRVFDVIGGAFFKELVRNDMLRNLDKIDQACQRRNVRSLQEMVRAEKEVGIDFEGSGTEALLWLKRTLQFILVLFGYLISESDETALATCARMAYEDTVKPCHNFILRNVFDAAMQCLPDRPAVYAELRRACGGSDNGDNGDAERQIAMKALTQIQGGLSELLLSIINFYNQNLLEDMCKVSQPSRLVQIRA